MYELVLPPNNSAAYVDDDEREHQQKTRFSFVIAMCEQTVPNQALVLELPEQEITPERNALHDMVALTSLADESVCPTSSILLEKTEFCDTGVSPPLSPVHPNCSYRLRFDPCNPVDAGNAHTSFKYVQCPVVDAESSPAAIACRQLTPAQAEAALDYFVSCGQRLSQMTRAYDDVNCLTDLLQEKERDLELAAIIGKSLLEGNRVLQSSNKELEARINDAEDACAQLRYDLRGTKQLLALYNSQEDADNDAEHDAAEFDADGSRRSGRRAPRDRIETLKQLETELHELRAENERLRSGAERLERSTDGFETEEISQVQQYIRDLAAANDRLRQLDTEVDQRSDDVVKAQEDKQRLADTISELEQKLKTCGVHLDELNQTLDLSYETEKYLADEYIALQAKYEHVCECLQSFQEEHRARHRLRTGSFGAGSVGSASSRQVLNDIDDEEENETEDESTIDDSSKKSPRRRRSQGMHSGDIDDNSEEGVEDEARVSKRRVARGKLKAASTAALSLAAQLAASNKENVVSRADALRRMLETVRCARLSSNTRHAWSHGSSSSTAADATTPVNTADKIITSNRRQTATDSGTCSDLESPSTFNLLWNQQRILTPPSSLYSEKSAAAAYCESRSSFINPRRLAFLTESSAEETDDGRHHRLLSAASTAGARSSSSSSRNNNVNSLQTEHHHHNHYAGGGGGRINYTGQLEIVKPLESSLTLHHWSKLCVPRMSDVLDERAGVHTKGENNKRNSNTITPSTSGHDMTLLLSTASRQSSQNDAVISASSSVWRGSTSNCSDAGNALIEHLLANISSHNRKNRDSRLGMQQQRSYDADMPNRNIMPLCTDAAESALGSSLENSLSTNCTLSSSGIASPSVASKNADFEGSSDNNVVPKNNSGVKKGGVLTRAHLISHSAAKHPPLAGKSELPPRENETNPSPKRSLNSPVCGIGCAPTPVVGNDKSPSIKSPFYREIVGAVIKQNLSTPVVVGTSSPLLRAKVVPAAASVEHSSNKDTALAAQAAESTSETDSID